MLSRSNTTTSDRLRRARSTTSMQAAASRQRAPATSDPFIARRHAEAAATLAYRCIQPTEPTTYADYRPAPPMLHRRKSQVTGRSEGSYLEDARLGRRRSAARREENKTTPSNRQKFRQSEPAAAVRESGSYAKPGITHQPLSDIKAAYRKERLTSAPNGFQRKPPPSFRSSSPPARSTSAVSGQNVTHSATTSRYTEKSYDDGISITYTEPQSYADRNKVETDLRPRRASIRETQTDEEIIAMARDRRLQDFQNQKIRERKSFFGSFQSLQKRNVTDKPAGGISYDSSLPPFNYADSSLVAPLPPTHDVAPPLTAPDQAKKPQGKPRIFSGSLKGQFKKLLRKASRVPSEPLPRLAEATIATDVVDHSNIHSPSVLNDPFVVQDPQAPLGRNTEALFLTSSLGSNLSVSGDSAADKSRVTSWTNSTAAGTTSTTARTTARTTSMSGADEHGRLQRSNSHSTLRKKGSFFGRSVQNRLRKSSRAELRESDDSHALFAALRERIMPQEATRESRERAESAASHFSQVSALSSLPSQQHAETHATIGNVKASTIRTVPPDPDAFKIEAMSPVIEVSPDRFTVDNVSAEQTPTASHYKSKHRPAPIQAEPPSPERIARRVKQSQTRWQGALNTAPNLDQRFASAYDEDDPYELPVLARKPVQISNSDTGGLPQHARMSTPADIARERFLSPSVYPRATNDVSPRPSTPEDEGLTVTITSREVKRYEISPSKRDTSVAQRPVQASKEWRKWLSAELDSFAEPDAVSNLALPHDTRPPTTAASSTRERAGSGSYGQRSDTPASDQASRSRRDSRPRASSRRSSYMNERYPIIESTDNPSRQSQRTNRKFSLASNAGTDTEHSSSQHPTSDDSNRSIDQARTRSRTTSLPKRHSLAHLESSRPSQPSKSPPSATSPVLTMSGAIQTQENTAPTATTSTTNTTTRQKHRSAFDLRAKYKSTSAGTSRPLAVRRRTTAPGPPSPDPAPLAILEDNTIRNISAGPYASSGGGGGAYANKENTTPAQLLQSQSADEAGLPALSSSEWLAGPGVGGKKRLEGGGREGSPGQRLVTGWLRIRGGGDGGGGGVCLMRFDKGGEMGVVGEL
ncbi:hypothetical protein Q7P37_005669 [Cladosporium fusiforme]